jgi:hypothetical protein
MSVARGDARAARGSGDDWGSYYENEPEVIVGKLADPAGHWCRGEVTPAPARAPGA